MFLFFCSSGHSPDFYAITPVGLVLFDGGGDGGSVHVCVCVCMFTCIFEARSQHRVSSSILVFESVFY